MQDQEIKSLLQKHFKNYQSIYDKKGKNNKAMRETEYHNTPVEKVGSEEEIQKIRDTVNYLIFLKAQFEFMDSQYSDVA